LQPQQNETSTHSLKVLDSTFFDRPAEKVAHDLVGRRLNWKHGNRSDSRIITETEAYTGPDDLASHAARGLTQRNEAMFGPPGAFYVYFVYGMHWMLNVVTGPVGYPAAVLIRSVEGISGPGRLTKALRITGRLNGRVASEETGFWFSEASIRSERQVIRSDHRFASVAKGPSERNHHDISRRSLRTSWSIGLNTLAWEGAVKAN
jgi:DNA-3-methyladenine glycosylase